MTRPLSIAFVWHMHQPYYRDLVTGACSMPWVRLHATKDYLDMLTRLDAFPAIHQTFNLVPSLVDQLEAYLPPGSQSDLFLEHSRQPADQLSGQAQRFILEWFFLANLERMIKPYPRYYDLLVKRGLSVLEEEWPQIQRRFRVQDYRDLQVWFNLVWIDPWLRRQDPHMARLEAKGGQFTEEEKHLVLDRHLTLMAQIIPAYRDAARRGQIELTTSPYYHPIVPLLCDVRSAHVASPNLPLPNITFRHPEDARCQLQEALARHQELFGTPPQGLWPPEGSVSEAAVTLALESGIRWIATDEAILWRTLNRSPTASLRYRPHLVRRKAGQMAVIFRDRELSDLIGFTYSQWEPQLAVADFLKRLETIAGQTKTEELPSLVSVILDGENAWEGYPDDGHEFLSGLYRALAGHRRFRCVTVSEFLKEYPLSRMESLPELWSGSWIEGDFTTWVGHPEKNAAWIQLAHARDALASLGNDPAPSFRAKAWRSLAAAEGSDWMWWFGDTHVSAQAAEFDRLFRLHVSNGYRLAGLDVPKELDRPIKTGEQASAIHGPTGLIHPTIDGRETSYYEWLYAGRLDLTRQYAELHRTGQVLKRLYYGFDQSHRYFRIDFDPQQLQACAGWMIELVVSEALRIHVQPARQDASEARPADGVEMPPGSVLAQIVSPNPAPLVCALERILELALPRDVAQGAGGRLQLVAMLKQGGEVVERHPANGTFELADSLTDMGAQMWSV
ncbi:MAG: glycoside hydrolase family 57 protein [Candidatus Omnitrophota bacterium]|nr:glycoside hydrolase family 57 protein [Candidatus Omnitrophota bacterium]